MSHVDVDALEMAWRTGSPPKEGGWHGEFAIGVVVTAVADRGLGIFIGVVGEAALSNLLTPTADEVASQLDAPALNLQPRVNGNR